MLSAVSTVLLFLNVFSVAVSALPAFTSYQFDTRNSGVCPFDGVASNKLNKQWKVDTKINDGEMIEGSAVVGVNGTVYFTQGYHIHAVSKDGDLLWSHRAAGLFRVSTPAVHDNGNIYVAGTDYAYSGPDNGYIYAFSPSGDLIWKLRLGRDSSFYHSSVNLVNEVIYAQAGGNMLYAVSLDGEIIWEYDSAPGYHLQGSMEKMIMTPAVSKDGTIITGSALGELHALSPAGKLLWKHAITPLFSFKAPAIDDDNNIVVVVDGGTGYDYNASVHSFTMDGTLRWSLDLTQQQYQLMDVTGLAIHDGVAYFASDYYIYGVSVSNGKIIAKYNVVDPVWGAVKVWGAPVVASGNKMLYFGAYDKLYGMSIENPSTLSAKSIVFRRGLDTYSNNFSPSLTQDGVIYTAAYTKLYAFTAQN